MCAALASKVRSAAHMDKTETLLSQAITTVLGIERLVSSIFSLLLEPGSGVSPRSFTFPGHPRIFCDHDLTYQAQVSDFWEQGRALAETAFSRDFAQRHVSLIAFQHR